MATARSSSQAQAALFKQLASAHQLVLLVTNQARDLAGISELEIEISPPPAHLLLVTNYTRRDLSGDRDLTERCAHRSLQVMASGGADGGPSRPETAEIAPRSGRDAAVAIGRESNSTPIGMVRGVEEAALSACLGNTWAHCVNTRLVAQIPPGSNTARSGGPVGPGPGGAWGGAPGELPRGGVRQLRVAKAPLCAEGHFEFVVTPDGPRAPW